MKIPEKILNFLSKLIPKFIKNFFKRFISPIYNFFSKSIPAYFNKKRTEAKKPLDQRLAELKKKENEILKDKEAKSIFVFVDWFNSALSKVKVAGKTFWEKLKDVVLAGLIISLFYYAIWYLIVVVLGNILTYLINTASGSQELLQQMQSMVKSGGGAAGAAAAAGAAGAAAPVGAAAPAAPVGGGGGGGGGVGGAGGAGDSNSSGDGDGGAGDSNSGGDGDGSDE